MNQKEFAQQTAYIIRRAYEFNKKGRKLGLAELGDYIDAKGLERRDIFELGIRLVLEGADTQYICMILSNMINMEQDGMIRRLKTIQRDAVMCIQEGVNSLLLLNTLFSLITDDELKETQDFLKDEAFTEFFKMY
jgi:flagellar motor component MotA